jgi:hypothetical protein
MKQRERKRESKLEDSLAIYATGKKGKGKNQCPQTPKRWNKSNE